VDGCLPRISAWLTWKECSEPFWPTPSLQRKGKIYLKAKAIKMEKRVEFVISKKKKSTEVETQETIKFQHVLNVRSGAGNQKQLCTL
jgi:hypothetical protein